jgi:hypothetical protein
LVNHGSSIEVFKINSVSSALYIDAEKLRMLANHTCMPRLKELSITRHFNNTQNHLFTIHPEEDAFIAVLATHKSTLELVKIKDPDENLLGTAFAQACLRLPKLRSIDVVFSPETNLSVLESLYDKHPQIGLNMLQVALDRLCMPGVCVVCLAVNDDLDPFNMHSFEECPDALSVSLKLEERLQWPEAERHGFCPDCFLPRPSCQRFAQRHGPEAIRPPEQVIEPLLRLNAAMQNPEWDAINAAGEPAYWRPLIRFLCRLTMNYKSRWPSLMEAALRRDRQA